MFVKEQVSALDQTEKISSTWISFAGKREKDESPLLREHRLDVYVNDVLTMKLVCSPEYLKELVLGRLFTEGMISDIHQVEGIYICESGRRARVFLKEAGERKEGPFVEVTPTCCTGNQVLDDRYIRESLKPVTPIPWKVSWIEKLSRAFYGDTPLHRSTGGTHSCFLFSGEEIVFACEDIGRHNALDKAVGYALREQIPLSSCLVFTSGRVPVDMAVKAIRAGIPILASKAAVTMEAVELAREYSLTLIGWVKREGMKLYTGREPEE